MKNVKFRLKSVETIPAVQGDPTRLLPDKPARTTLILSPEDFNGSQEKLKISVPEAGDYQRGDIFEVSVNRVSKVKAPKEAPKEKKEKAPKEGEQTEDGDEEAKLASDIEFINTLEDPEAVKAFAKDDDREGVKEAAKERIKELKKENK